MCLVRVLCSSGGTTIACKLSVLVPFLCAVVVVQTAREE